MVLSPTAASGNDIAERHRAQDRKFLHQILTQKGGGCFLRGWRREIDPDGSLDVPTDEFIRLLKKVGANDVHVKDLVGDAEELTLDMLAPVEGELVHRMRDWIKDTCGDPGGLWDVIDVKQTGSLDREGWKTSCLSHGFHGTAEELSQIFDFIDVDEGGTVCKEEILFLEKDSDVRDTLIFKEKMKAKGQVQRLLAAVYWTDMHKDIPPSSRSAIRPWMAHAFENLPSLVIVKRQQRLRDVRKQHREAKTALLQHLRQAYGSCARAWRRGLDPHSKFTVDKMQLRHFCRCQELRVNVHALWLALDTDSDGIVGFQDVAKGAVALAAFRAWCKRNHGSCAAVWDLPEMVRVRGMPQTNRRQIGGKLTSTKKVLVELFVETLQALGWSGTEEKEAEAEIWSALDFFNAGFISQADLRWLDSWEPPLWLAAEPSEAAWKEVKDLLLEKYGLPLNAWRLLDADGQNEVCWSEFIVGCKKVKFKGDIGAAWRFIDDDASGFISMKEFSPEHYELLMSFKEWASGLYGSVGNAFKNFDKDGSGSLTYGELRRACQKGKWGGDVKFLFDCLGMGSVQENASKRVMTADQISFLDSWPGEADEDDEEEEEQMEAVVRPPRSPKKTMSAAPSSRKADSRPATAAADDVDRPSSSPMTGPASPMRPSTSALALQRPSTGLEKATNMALPVAMSPEKKKQLQRTYRCAGSMGQQARQKRQKWEAAKSKLPWLEKIQRIDLGEEFEDDSRGHRQRRSASVADL